MRRIWEIGLWEWVHVVWMMFGRRFRVWDFAEVEFVEDTLELECCFLFLFVVAVGGR